MIKEHGTLVPAERGQKRKVDGDRHERAEKRARKELVSKILNESQETEIPILDEAELPTLDQAELPAITHADVSIQTEATDGN